MDPAEADRGLGQPDGGAPRRRCSTPAELPALIYGENEGVLHHRALDDLTYEIVTLEAFRQWRGIGTALVERVAEIAKDRGYRELAVVTTNDNLDALQVLSVARVPALCAAARGDRRGAGAEAGDRADGQLRPADPRRIGTADAPSEVSGIYAAGRRKIV